MVEITPKEGRLLDEPTLWEVEIDGEAILYFEEDDDNPNIAIHRETQELMSVAMPVKKLKRRAARYLVKNHHWNRIIDEEDNLILEIRVGEKYQKDSQ